MLVENKISSTSNRQCTMEFFSWHICCQLCTTRVHKLVSLLTPAAGIFSARGRCDQAGPGKLQRTQKMWAEAGTWWLTGHYKICGMISSRSESEPTIRHGHQLIFLMKVDWFWCSEMKRRFSQLHTLMSRLLIVKKTLFSSQNTKINQLSSGISAGAHV